MSVYAGEKPFDKIGDIQVQDESIHLENAFDMVASAPTGMLLICEHNKSVIWKIRVSDNKISSWSLDGKPNRMSTNASGQVLVLIWKKTEEERARRDNVLTPTHLDVYEPSDGKQLKSILPNEEEFSRAYHAVQTTRGTYVIAHAAGKFIEDQRGDEFFTAFPNGEPRVLRGIFEKYFISEINASGDVVQLIKQHTAFDEKVLSWPRHLAIDSGDRVFIADHRNDRIVMLDTKAEGMTSKVVLSALSISKPVRVCYIEEERRLIVGQTGNSDVFSVFKVEGQ